MTKQGITLMELIVVLIIVGIAAAMAFPNFTNPLERAHATAANTNLLAIYSAQRNYYNNHPGTFCSENIPSPEPSCAESLTASCGGDLASLNCNLSLNIQDDGTYTYSCSGVTSTCTATRTSIATSNTLVLSLNAPVALSGAASNPACHLTSPWCP